MPKYNSLEKCVMALEAAEIARDAGVLDAAQYAQVVEDATYAMRVHRRQSRAACAEQVATELLEAGFVQAGSGRWQRGAVLLLGRDERWEAGSGSTRTGDRPTWQAALHALYLTTRISSTLDRHDAVYFVRKAVAARIASDACKPLVSVREQRVVLREVLSELYTDITGDED